MSEEEKKAIDDIRYRNEHLYCDKTDFDFILNLIDKLQKELEEKTTILMAGADKVKQLEKENQELELNMKQIRTIVLDFIPHSMHEVDLKVNILKFIRR